MKKSIKFLVAVIAISVFSRSTITAQEKYDYAMIYYGGYPKQILALSVNGVKYEERNIEKEELQSKVWYSDLNPALKRMGELQLEGWELDSYTGMPTLANGGGYTFLLKRKQK